MKKILIQTVNDRGNEERQKDNKMKINPFKAMQYAGVTRDDLRKLNKQERILMWMMIVATIEWDRQIEV